MATNGTEIGAPPERPLLRRRVAEPRAADREYERSYAEQERVEVRNLLKDMDAVISTLTALPG